MNFWHSIILFLAGPGAGYLMGSIPFGLLIGWAHGVDIRTRGSGNIGATNLGRILGRKYFFYAFFLDALKGFLPVLAVSNLTAQWHGYSLTPLLTAAAAVLGHVFPLYLKFKGGKGVATGLGCVLGIWPVYTLAGIASLIVFILLVLAYRYISLASIISCASFPVFVLWFGMTRLGPIDTFTPWPQLGPLLVTAVLFALMIVVKHRTNIRRLLAGMESKVGERNKSSGTGP